jgi:hypothetical protein
LKCRARKFSRILKSWVVSRLRFRCPWAVRKTFGLLAAPPAGFRRSGYIGRLRRPEHQQAGAGDRLASRRAVFTPSDRGGFPEYPQREPNGEAAGRSTCRTTPLPVVAWRRLASGRAYAAESQPATCTRIGVSTGRHRTSPSRAVRSHTRESNTNLAGRVVSDARQLVCGSGDSKLQTPDACRPGPQNIRRSTPHPRCSRSGWNSPGRSYRISS